MDPTTNQGELHNAVFSEHSNFSNEEMILALDDGRPTTDDRRPVAQLIEHRTFVRTGDRGF